MSRIKYPNKKEIDIQISDIIDKSGIFDKMQSDQTGFTECVQVRPGRNYRKAVTTICAVAATVLLIIAGANWKQVGVSLASKSQPMTSIIAENGQNTVSWIKLNNSIVVDSTESSKVMGISQDSKSSAEDSLNTSVKVSESYTIPTVYHNEQEVTPITEFYNHKVNSLQENIANKYESLDAVYGNEKATNKDIPINIDYTCSAVLGISEKNTDIISIFENYSETAKEGERIKTVKESYGNNFSIKDGKRIDLKSIFTDSNAGLLEAARELNRMMNDAHGWSNADDSESLYQNVYQYLNDGYWYFSTDGITICCNGIHIETSEYSGTTYNNIYSETYVIPYNSLYSLKSEYHN